MDLASSLGRDDLVNEIAHAHGWDESEQLDVFDAIGRGIEADCLGYELGGERLALEVPEAAVDPAVVNVFAQAFTFYIERVCDFDRIRDKDSAATRCVGPLLRLFVNVVNGEALGDDWLRSFVRLFLHAFGQHRDERVLDFVLALADSDGRLLPMIEGELGGRGFRSDPSLTQQLAELLTARVEPHELRRQHALEGLDTVLADLACLWHFR
jgi:hypothetical protein